MASSKLCVEVADISVTVATDTALSPWFTIPARLAGRAVREASPDPRTGKRSPGRPPSKCPLQLGRSMRTGETFPIPPPRPRARSLRPHARPPSATTTSRSAARVGPPAALLAGSISLQVLRQVLVHLEHAHLLLAEHRLQLVIRQNLAAVFRVLEIVFLDVVPDLAHHLAARQGRGADHRGEFLRRLQRLLERGAPLARRLARLRFPASRLGFGRHGSPPSRSVRPRFAAASPGRSPGPRALSSGRGYFPRAIG